ncbi:unnamed protein product, partial [Arabidopsis lyrata]
GKAKKVVETARTSNIQGIHLPKEQIKHLFSLLSKIYVKTNFLANDLLLFQELFHNDLLSSTIYKQISFPILT